MITKQDLERGLIDFKKWCEDVHNSDDLDQMRDAISERYGVPFEELSEFVEQGVTAVIYQIVVATVQGGGLDTDMAKKLLITQALTSVLIFQDVVKAKEPAG